MSKKLSKFEKNMLKELDNEIWDKQHPEWKVVETLYGDKVEVSNTGMVRDPETKEPYKVYRPFVKDKEWYPLIIVKSKDKKYRQTVHRLVAKAFVPNPKNKPEVNHIDGNKDNNWYKNLEWVTRSENLQAAVDIDLIKSGEDSPVAKYSNDQIRYVCQLLQDHPEWSFEKIKSETGVDAGTVGGIYRKDRWKKFVGDYKYPTRDAMPKGENHPNSIYNNEQIKQVCELLKTKDMTFKDIGQQTGVHKDTVKEIYNRKRWLEISHDYEFEKRDQTVVCSVEQAEQICKLLDEVSLGRSNATHVDIANAVGVKKGVVNHISAGERWVDIAKSHLFYKAKFGDQAKQRID